jgi:anti-anti-sigma factor
MVAEGELDLAVVGSLEELGRRLAFEPGAHVVADLRRVTFMDSSIVGWLLAVDARAAGVGARFEVVAAPSSGAGRTLTVCGADALLTVVTAE